MVFKDNRVILEKKLEFVCIFLEVGFDVYVIIVGWLIFCIWFVVESGSLEMI